VERPVEGPITVESGVTLRELSQALGRPLPALIKELMIRGTMRTANQSLSDDEVETLASAFEVEVRVRHSGEPTP
jgi:hypothetical protein